MKSLCCKDVTPYRDRPNMPHEPKFTAFLDAYPSISAPGGSSESERSASSRDKSYRFIIQLVYANEASAPFP